MLYFVRQCDRDMYKRDAFKRSNDRPVYEKDYSWHVGDGIPSGFDDVCEVQADGHELDLILKRFPNLPIAKYENGDLKRVMLWSGDFAKFIYHNL